jgi:transposase-like protein
VVPGGVTNETYLQVKGAGVNLYRAVDQAGKAVDFYVSRNRDVAAAKAFLRKAMRQPRPPTKITLDAYAASHRAVADLKKTGELAKRVRVRSRQYLNHTSNRTTPREAATRPDAGTAGF